MKNPVFAILLVLSISCKQENDKTEMVDKPVDVEVTECFAYHKNGDTVTMTMSRLGDVARGQLIYKLYQKDGNSGTFSGNFSGDTLFIDYRFESEGMMSEREEAFLFSKNLLTKLNGEIEMDGLRQKIKDRRKLESGQIALAKVTCQ